MKAECYTFPSRVTESIPMLCNVVLMFESIGKFHKGYLDIMCKLQSSTFLCHFFNLFF